MPGRQEISQERRSVSQIVGQEVGSQSVGQSVNWTGGHIFFIVTGSCWKSQRAEPEGNNREEIV